MADTYTLADLMEEQRTLGGPPALPDVRPQEMRSPPLGQSLDRNNFVANAIHGALSLLGRSAVDATREGLEGRRTPQEVAQTYLTEGPWGGPMGSVRAPARVPNPIRAYHGSPHDFDEFNLAHIGRGEGAQAYGHGMYFAEAEPVAETYRRAQGAFAYEGRPLTEVWNASRPNEQQRRIFTALTTHDNFQDALAMLRRPGTPIAEADAARLEQWAREGRVAPHRGRMYEVNLHARPEQFLDWDVPIGSHPPPLRDAVNRLLVPPNTQLPTPETIAAQLQRAARSRERGEDATAVFSEREAARRQAMLNAQGREAYSAVSRNLGREEAAEALTQAGIPGIRYLDQGTRDRAFRVDLATSRGPYRTDEPPITFGTMQQAQAYADDMAARGFTTNVVDQGTRNYVVFNPEIIEILRKWGIIAPPVGAGAAASLNGEPQP